MYFGCIIKLYIYFKQWRYEEFEYEVAERLWIQQQWDQIGYYNMNNSKCGIKIQETKLHIAIINLFYLFTVWVMKLHSRGYHASNYGILLCWCFMWMECELTINSMLQVQNPKHLTGTGRRNIATIINAHLCKLQSVTTQFLCDKNDFNSVGF